MAEGTTVLELKAGARRAGLWGGISERLDPKVMVGSTGGLGGT